MNNPTTNTCGDCKHFNADKSQCRRTSDKTASLILACRKFEQNEESTLTEDMIIADCPEAPQFRTCKVCGRELPLDAFPKNANSKDGYGRTCSECLSNNHKKGAEKKAAEPKPAKQQPSFQDWTDESLVNELRRRGYKGELKKIVETTFAL